MNGNQSAEIKDAMGEWLGDLAPWDVFGTWTFDRIVTAAGAMAWARKYFAWVEKVAQQPIYGYIGAERGESGGLIHLHGLMGNVKHLQIFCGARLPRGVFGNTCCMVHAWRCGISRVMPYDPKLGAKHYVAKYVVKRLAEWELYGFPARPQTAFAHKRSEFVENN